MINLNRIYFITKINNRKYQFVPSKENDFQSTLKEEDFSVFFLLFFVEFGSKEKKKKLFSIILCIYSQELN